MEEIEKCKIFLFLTTVLLFISIVYENICLTLLDLHSYHENIQTIPRERPTSSQHRPRPEPEIPFAIVNSVEPRSPAFEAVSLTCTKIILSYIYQNA